MSRIIFCLSTVIRTSAFHSGTDTIFVLHRYGSVSEKVLILFGHSRQDVKIRLTNDCLVRYQGTTRAEYYLLIQTHALVNLTLIHAVFKSLKQSQQYYFWLPRTSLEDLPYLALSPFLWCSAFAIVRAKAYFDQYTASASWSTSWWVPSLSWASSPRMTSIPLHTFYHCTPDKVRETVMIRDNR